MKATHGRIVQALHSVPGIELYHEKRDKKLALGEIEVGDSINGTTYRIETFHKDIPCYLISEGLTINFDSFCVKDNGLALYNDGKLIGTLWPNGSVYARLRRSRTVSKQ